ncbi:MAG: DNA-directed RNA polymerase subunit omega [Holosporaceae bacterium]|jgi:DNA-directed RNA polymerase subunit omega|nr:DNA-directed RNA polymerase subunit omega [Holosporaceae bacterium]
MARITIEDCEQNVKNRFDLVILASQRTRQLLAGDKLTVSNEKNEKKSVIALREIAAGSVSIDSLRESTISMFRSFSPTGDFTEELDELMEEDTYNPSVDLNSEKVLELSNNMSIVSVDDASIGVSDTDDCGDDYEISENEIAAE